MAAWDLPSDVVKKVVGGCKRSPTYRRVRTTLSSPCPTDVWTDGGVGFVQYEVEDGPRLAWVVFAVELETGTLITAKSLCPDESGRNILVTDLHADVVARTEGPR